MSDIAISCERLGKEYRIGQRERYRALRDTLTDTFSAPFRRFRKNASGDNGRSNLTHETFWALKEVSFEVRHGEVIGIIGRNGAGKSTLLKILSRITKPTEGHVKISGRVGSLLEVGTGFHPELTGRENIYLNGTILGMKKHEITRQFDEIVAFAEIEKFLDTPVKRYSSGMYVRLAFAVAAHLEPEVLLVDEVLAVGDTAFQKKCMGKIGAVAKQGRTVLLVSHNMAAVQSICQRSVFLNKGSVALDGNCGQVINAYLRHLSSNTKTAITDLKSHSHRRAGCVPLFSSVTTINALNQPSITFSPGDDLIIEFCLEPPFTLNQPAIGIGIDNSMGLRVFSVYTFYSPNNWERMERPTKVRCIIPHITLAPGQYSMTICVGTIYDTLIDAIDHAASFNVEPSDYFGTGRIPNAELGVVLARSRWEFC